MIVSSAIGNVIVPSVLAGNAVLVKHASQTALVADQFVRAFADAGAPDGLVQAFPVDHETAAKVIATRRIDWYGRGVSTSTAN